MPGVQKDTRQMMYSVDTEYDVYRVPRKEYTTLLRAKPKASRKGKGSAHRFFSYTAELFSFLSRTHQTRRGFFGQFLLPSRISTTSPM